MSKQQSSGACCNVTSTQCQILVKLELHLPRKTVLILLNLKQIARSTVVLLLWPGHVLRCQQVHGAQSSASKSQRMCRTWVLSSRGGVNMLTSAPLSIASLVFCVLDTCVYLYFVWSCSGRLHGNFTLTSRACSLDFLEFLDFLELFTFKFCSVNGCHFSLLKH